MKSVLILEGAGFSDQGDLAAQLRGWGCDARRRTISLREPLTSAELAGVDLVMIRGPWSMSCEERALSTLLASRVAPALLQVETKPWVIGIGRGAMILMQAMVQTREEWAQTVWEENLSEEGPWINATWNGEAVACLVQGRALPKFTLQAPTWDLWLESKGRALGWKSRARRMMFSFVDPLAFADRVQLPGFGYQDLISMQTRSRTWELLVDECGAQ